ncbi:hypothetical protein [Rathayibacter sp. VKM Ac-2801]|uniref:hypothetical protein n=1 Tax=Rathayibacter sp. VKM Ac-2801 TaxID=2609255 RepID=UPI00131FAAF3|nr:hypothetical protein [Rathayibacter sp. VKM Ac-2801]QHC69287.1 hypothetical protein GSU45_02070 [Rathayibacter sp. VKM Ac-2801]
MTTGPIRVDVVHDGVEVVGRPRRIAVGLDDSGGADVRHRGERDAVGLGLGADPAHVGDVELTRGAQQEGVHGRVAVLLQHRDVDGRAVLGVGDGGRVLEQGGRDRVARDELTAPLLILRGSHDPIATDEWCTRLLEAAGGGTLRIVPGHRHVVVHTAAADVADAIVEHARSTATVPPSAA